MSEISNERNSRRSGSYPNVRKDGAPYGSIVAVCAAVPPMSDSVSHYGITAAIAVAVFYIGKLIRAFSRRRRNRDEKAHGAESDDS
jgi:hypothetical protein